MSNLKAILEKKQVIAPFVVDGLQAIMAKAAGFEAVYASGFGAASTLGMPDVGLLTLTQMADKIRAITASCDIPVVADADTGYGNYVNVYQTVQMYERAGAAGLHIEDQLWPKRCGYMAGKQVVDKEEAITKIKAAVDARVDPNFIIIARTDALAVDGWDEAEGRIRAYIEVGADMAFVDGIQNVEDIQNYTKRLEDVPLIFNNVPMIPMKKITALAPNFKLILNPYAMANAWQAYEKALISIKNDELPDASEMDREAFTKIVTILGAPKYFEMDKRYSAE